MAPQQVRDQHITPTQMALSYPVCGSRIKGKGEVKIIVK